MSAAHIAAVVFAGSFVAAMVGMLLRKILPDNHLDSDAKDVMKLVMGLIGTMAALILGLLIASGNSSYNAQRSELQTLAANAVILDRLLQAYGPEAAGARESFREIITTAHDLIWTPDGLRPPNFDAANKLAQQIQNLAPKSEQARSLQSRATQLTESMLHMRVLMTEQQGDAIPTLFLEALVYWICALFLGFGLLARFNPTIMAAFIVGAISVAAAIFLILELNEPYRGYLQISDAPLRHALERIGK
ncbi:MAG: DUF4239 domain-containing protein [Methylocystis sp.]|jgi:hypothetical protein